MATLTLLLTLFLDPVQGLAVLVMLRLYRGGHPILLAAATAALASETILAVASDSGPWGELLVLRFVAALMQAALLYHAYRIVVAIWEQKPIKIQHRDAKSLNGFAHSGTAKR